MSYKKCPSGAERKEIGKRARQIAMNAAETVWEELDELLYLIDSDYWASRCKLTVKRYGSNLADIEASFAGNLRIRAIVTKSESQCGWLIIPHSVEVWQTGIHFSLAGCELTNAVCPILTRMQRRILKRLEEHNNE